MNDASHDSPSQHVGMNSDGQLQGAPGGPADIAYGGGEGAEAIKAKGVMCEPMDFACFFGFSR